MNVCKICGTQCSDKAVFCTGCGARLEPPLHNSSPSSVSAASTDSNNSGSTAAPINKDNVHSEKKPRKKRRGVAIVITIAFVISVTAGGIMYLRWYLSPEQRLLRTLSAGDLSSAAELVEQKRSLRRNNAFIDALKNRIDQIKSQYTEGTMEYAAAKEELNVIQDMEVKDLTTALSATQAYLDKLNASRIAFSLGQTMLNEGAYTDAMAQYQLVIQEDKNYQTAQLKYAEAVSSYREQILQDAATYAEAKSYSSAIELLNTALQQLPNDSQLTQQVTLYQTANLENQKSTTLSTAQQYADQGKPETAMQILNEYLVYYGEDIDIQLAYDQNKEQYVTAVLTEAETVAATGDYLSAIDILHKGAEPLSEEPRLAQRQETYLTDYVNSVLKQSNAHLDKKEYTQATDVINKALENAPEHASLLDQLTKIEAARPSYSLLEVCKPYEHREFTSYTNGKVFYMGGNEYSNGFRLYQNHGSTYAFFNLDGNYSKLSFICGHFDGASMTNDTVSIYCDGVLTKEFTVSCGDLPCKYELDITGVKQLKIYFDGANRTSAAGFAEVTVR